MHSVGEYNPTFRLLLFEANELQPYLCSQHTATILIFHSHLFLFPVQYNSELLFSHSKFSMRVYYFIS